MLHTHVPHPTPLHLPSFPFSLLLPASTSACQDLARFSLYLTWTRGRAQENQISAETAAEVERLYAEGAEKYFEVNDTLSLFEVGELETRERASVNWTSESSTDRRVRARQTDE
jgi:hypothetical protein